MDEDQNSDAANKTDEPRNVSKKRDRTERAIDSINLCNDSEEESQSMWLGDEPLTYLSRRERGITPSGSSLDSDSDHQRLLQRWDKEQREGRM